jgi:hypothetical protein
MPVRPRGPPQAGPYCNRELSYRLVVAKRNPASSWSPPYAGFDYSKKLHDAAAPRLVDPATI